MRAAAALLLGAALATAQESGSRSRELARLYFAAQARDEQRAVLERLERLDAPSRAELDDLAAFCLAEARRGTLIDDRREQTCTHPDYPGRYVLVVPPHARTKPTGVFISLHGGGNGAGEAAHAIGLFGTPAPGLINVYPTVLQKVDRAWNAEREERYVLAILEEIKRTYNVDTNRVYLAGHSMGGFGAWSIGGRHADLFAALSSMAGGVIGDGMMPNLRNTPIWFYHSADDPNVSDEYDLRAARKLAALAGRHGGYEHVWKHYRDIGHGLPDGGARPIFEWMLKKKRDPAPKRVVWEASRAYKRTFYWLRRETPGGTVEASIDGNRIDIVGDARRLEILLNEKLVDLAEPVVVRVNGEEEFRGRVELSTATVVESIAASNDPEMVFVAKIRL